MKLADELRRLLHGEPLTQEEVDFHAESGESFHVPAIVHRTGNISAEVLNTCGICGTQIIPTSGHGWVKVSHADADRLPVH